MGAVESLLGGGTSYKIGQYSVTKVKQLAEGGFSFVDLVRDDNRSNTQYALKRILCQTPEQLAAAKAEIALHNAISHPFVLALLDSDIQKSKSSQIQSDEALLLFPLYSHGSIVDVVQRYLDKTQPAGPSSSSSSPASPRAPTQPWPFPEHEALRLFYAIGQGVQAIHGAGVAHRDIKPHNILLSFPYQGSSASPSPTASSSASSGSLPSEPVPIIIDLGSADTLVQTPEDRKTAFALQERAAEHTTASYRPPELFEVRVSQVIDDRSEVWMMALVLYFMAFGSSAFENEQEGVMTLAIRGGSLTIPEEFVLAADGSPPPKSRHHPSRLFSQDFVAFLREMLVADPNARLTLKDAMKKTCILIAAVLERNQKAAAAIPQPTLGDDEFGAFSSATSTLTLAELDLLITDMQLGSSSSTPAYSPGGLLKCGRKGNPHSTRLQLTADKSSITWTSKGGGLNTVPLPRIFSLVTGQVTAKFARFQTNPTFSSKAHLSFSLLLKPAGQGEDYDPTSGEETLDLIAESHQIYRTWTTGIQALLSGSAAAQPTIGI